MRLQFLSRTVNSRDSRTDAGSILCCWKAHRVSPHGGPVSPSTLLLASAAVKPRLPPSFSTTTSSSSSSSLYFHSFLPSRCAEPQTVLQLRAARCEDGRRLVCSQAGPTVAVRAHSCPHGAAGADADCVELQHPRLRGRKRKRRVKRAGEEGPGRGQQSRWQPLFPARGQAAAASPSAWERGVSPHTAAGKTEALPMYSYRIPREKKTVSPGMNGVGRQVKHLHAHGRAQMSVWIVVSRAKAVSQGNDRMADAKRALFFLLYQCWETGILGWMLALVWSHTAPFERPFKWTHSCPDLSLKCQSWVWNLESARTHAALSSVE